MPSLWVHVFRKAKVENILIFPRSQMAFPDFLLLALTQRKAVCLVNDGNTKGSGFFFCLTLLLGSCVPKKRLLCGISTPLWVLPDSFGRWEWHGQTHRIPEPLSFSLHCGQWVESTDDWWVAKEEAMFTMERWDIVLYLVGAEGKLNQEGASL